jgi:hypothetical protein
MASLMALISLEETMKRVGSWNVDIWSAYFIAQPFPVCVSEPSVKIGTVSDRFLPYLIVELAISGFVCDVSIMLQ